MDKGWWASDRADRPPVAARKDEGKNKLYKQISGVSRTPDKPALLADVSSSSSSSSGSSSLRELCFANERHSWLRARVYEARASGLGGGIVREALLSYRIGELDIG